MLSYMFTLLGVCGLAVGSLAALRKAKSGGFMLGPVAPIRLVGRQALGGGANLTLVEVDGRRMLIAFSRSAVSLIEIADARSDNVVPFDASFSATLKRARARP